MADKKEYTPQEVAEAILKKCEELIKSSNLAKANSAHEIDPGSEASNSEADCPEQLAGGSSSSEESGEESEDKEKKKKKSDESEEKDKEESQDESEEESDESEEEEEKKPFEKSENLEKLHYNMKKEHDVKKEEGMSVEEAADKIMSDKYEVHDVMDKVHSSKRGKVLAALRGKDAKKAEMCKTYMAKCGDMKTMGKTEKLKDFIEKRKKK